MRPGLLSLGAIFLVIATTTLPARAVGSLADVTVIDRNTGATLPVHFYRGEYWVAGSPGTRYAVSIRNRTSGRVLAVTSVDGVNILSGENAGFNQSGYVFSPREGYQLTGWRKSNSEVAAFEFSAAGDSYAGQTGRPANVGVIGVALFREKPEPAATPSWPTWSPRSRLQQREENAAESSLADGSAAARGSALPPAPPAPSPAAKAAPQAEAAASTGELQRRPAPQSASAPATPKLGTAHGERETSYTSTTSFERQQDRPNEIIQIRYDSRQNLIAAGVIREPSRPGGPTAFPDAANAQYVPDPPHRRY
ncbi:MAG: hypothetical protein EOO28_22515 [Comamonadaceae bacterium]|nr:MAG: hypothetical protein EOO28_22515 [Comamonadaceae bacterium]